MSVHRFAIATGLVSLASLAVHAQSAEPAEQEIVITAKRLDSKRDAIAPALGASDYIIDQRAIAIQPQGMDTGFNQVILQTPGGRIRYDGDARIDGVPGTSAPIKINFLDTAGSVCKSLLPTKNVRDVIGGVAVTCIDNGMPVVLIKASDLGRTGYETKDQLNADTELKARIEAIRLKAGPLMNLGDVTKMVVPKMCLISPPKSGSGISTRTFIPHDCHSAVGVLGAVTVATACVLKGSVAEGVAVLPAGDTKVVSVEHPTGEFSVELGLDPADPQSVTRSALLRTARLIMRGEVLIPSAVWDGKQSARLAA